MIKMRLKHRPTCPFDEGHMEYYLKQIDSLEEKVTRLEGEAVELRLELKKADEGFNELITMYKEVEWMTSTSNRRILITGSRNYAEEGFIRELLRIEKEEAIKADKTLVVVHGDCPTGADALAQRLCEEMSIVTERHPADWNEHGKAAGPLRNQEMVDLGADICYAYSLPGSRGTRDCKVRAAKAGIEVIELGVV